MGLFRKRPQLQPVDMSMIPPISMPMGIPTETTDDIFFKNELMRATEKIIEDKTAEERMGKNFPLWSILTKSMKLTFFDDKDAAILHNLFEAEVCKLERSRPPAQHDVDESLQVGQARMMFYSNIRRSVGTIDRAKVNERIALLSQIKQFFNYGGEMKKGFLSRLTGK
jgi:hypothetical protein